MPGEPNELLRIDISVPLWLVLGVTAAAPIAAFVVQPSHRAEIGFVVTVLTGSAAICTACYVGVGLRLKIEREKRQARFEILSLLNRPEFVAVRGFVDRRIEGHDKESKETPAHFIEFEKLATAWGKQKKLSDGRCFPAT